MDAKDKYMTVLNMLDTVMHLLGDENEVAISTIDSAQDMIKEIMYTDPRC